MLRFPCEFEWLVVMCCLRSRVSQTVAGFLSQQQVVYRFGLDFCGSRRRLRCFRLALVQEHPFLRRHASSAECLPLLLLLWVALLLHGGRMWARLCNDGQGRQCVAVPAEGTGGCTLLPSNREVLVLILFSSCTCTIWVC